MSRNDPGLSYSSNFNMSGMPTLARMSEANEFFFFDTMRSLTCLDEVEIERYFKDLKQFGLVYVKAGDLFISYTNGGVRFNRLSKE